MYKVLADYANNVCEQLNRLEEDHDVIVLTSEFVNDKNLKVLIKYAPHVQVLTIKAVGSEIEPKQTFAGQAKEPAVVKVAPKKAPAVKKS
jgi:hypothetical protein